ncbi:N-acetylmuramoyl-L-alanine amidase [candidate division WOR-3 bacterium]|nr:N-acetylmuramoyl-L-alanine amidase [candidate division WOR-3 bacterium]
MILSIVALISIIPNTYEITWEEQHILVESETIDFQNYVALKPIADFLSINYVLDNRSQRLFLTESEQKVELIGDIGTICYNNTCKNVPFAPVRMHDDIYFPASEIVTMIASGFGKLIFVKEVKEAPKIDKIALSPRGDSTVIKFSWVKPVNFDVQFFMKNAVIELDGVYKKEELNAQGAITAVELLPYNTYTRLELDLDGVNAYLERDQEIVFYYKLSQQIKRIVIDPGHGGVDPGAVGKKGLYEKDANLAIAKYLKELLTDSLDVNVVMTRETDKYLSLKARTQIANRNCADLFISIHCNASAKSNAMGGFETYFLAEARTTDERAVAMRENASLKFDGIEPASVLDKILLDLAQTAYLEESNCFAELVQQSAEHSLPVKSRGVKQAGFYVLRGAFMPAILVECAFISNLDEEKLLKEKTFRQKLALTLFQGIRDYINHYERRLNN